MSATQPRDPFYAALDPVVYSAASRDGVVERILRERDVHTLTGLDRVSRWRMEREGKFPIRVKLGANSIGWLASEIQRWIAERAAERSAA